MNIVSFTKYLAYGFLSILALLVVLILLAMSPLGVSALVNIANKQEGVSIEDPSGSFYSEITVSKVRFNNAQIELAVDSLALDLGLSCMFAGKACIDSISAQHVDVVLIENTKPSPESEPLTEYIELPLAAHLESFYLKRLTVSQQSATGNKTQLAALDKINISLSMHKTFVLKELSIENALVVLPSEPTNDENAIAEQNIDVGEHWIKLLKQAEYVPIALPEIFVPINGEIQKVTLANLCVEQLEAICTEKTHINAKIHKQKLTANIVTQPQNQIVSNIDLRTKVDFSEAFSHDIKLTLKANAKKTSSSAQALTVQLIGDVNNTRFSINSPKASNSIISLTAKQDVTEQSLPLHIELNASNYYKVVSAWLPNVEVPMSELNLLLDGNTEAYQFEASVLLDTEQTGKINLAGEASLTNKYFNISDLSTTGELGKLKASVETKLSQLNSIDTVVIASDIGFKNLQVKPLVPEVDSQLNGSIKLNANVTQQALWGKLNCAELGGKLQGFDLSLLCDVSISKAGLVNVKSLSLKQGKNTIEGKGKFELPSGLNTSEFSSADIANTQWVQNTNTALNLNINLVDLTSLFAEATGTIVGKATVTGKVDKPNVVGNIEVDSLKFNQLVIQKANVDILLDIANNWETNISVLANNIWQGTMLAQQVDVEVSGNLSAHNVSLSLAHPEYSLNHEISGEAIVTEQDWRWLGTWENGEFASAFDSFTLDKPTDIRVNPNRASIKPHCWLSSQLSSTSKSANTNVTLFDDGNKALCIEKVLYTSDLTELDARLAYNLKVPLLHYFPDLIKQGTSLPLNTDIALTYSQEKGLALDTHSLMTQANVISSKHNIELVAVVANASLKDQMISTTVFAGTKETGAVGLNSTLNLDPSNRTHKGQLRIDNFLLSPLQRFIPTVEKLAGGIAGNIAFDGPLIEPELNGELKISDVEVVLDNYPYPLTNFNQTVTIENKKANIEGEFELGAGTADYTGILTLFDNEQPFSFEGELQGAGMQLAFGENEVLASPSLKIAVDPSNFSLKGDITIPNAQIKIAELPESAKSPSSDTIVFGKEPEPPLVPIGLDVDIRILLDPPKLKRVSINALDLKASLGGDINVQVRQTQNLITKEFSPLETYVYGTVNVLSGSYEAYGQNLQIEKGSIYFSGAPSLPQFDITAVRNPLNTADNVVAGIRISGNPVVPKVEIFSNPTMTQARQLSYLLQGTDLNGGAGQSQDVMLVNMLVNYGVGNSENGVNRFGKSLGFDSLNVQTAGQGTNTQVQLTGRISDDIQVTYGVGLFSQASEVILRYQLLPQMYLEAKSGATSAVDLFYEWTRGE
jgi:translocation and assembly module TamB